MNTVTYTRDFGRVAVLVGGHSSERQISLHGGRAVYEALKRKNVDAELIDIKEQDMLSVCDYDRAFIMVHGEGGEDGRLQGYLDILGIPYCGSGVQASSVCMNKYLTKILWEKQGVQTPPYALMQNNLSQYKGSYPVVVKPCAEGSSIGMSIVKNEEILDAAFCEAKRYDQHVLLEQWIEGDELTVAIIDNTALPVIHIKTGGEFYDYQAKYEAEDTCYLFPEYDENELKLIQNGALEAFKVLGAEGWGRVDLIRDKAGELWFLEVNTVPGMTDHSLVPKAAEKMGIGYDELTVMILETTLKA